MSALPPKVDIAQQDENVRFVPKADIARFQWPSERLAMIVDDFKRDQYFARLIDYLDLSGALRHNRSRCQLIP